MTIGHSNNDEKWMEKCYSYFLAYVDTFSRKKIRNFKHRVHETWPQTYGYFVFEFYKKQTWLENHETCRGAMIWYGEVVVKISQSFIKVVTCNTYKPENMRIGFFISCVAWIGFKHCTYQSFTKRYEIFITVSPYDIMISRQVS